VSNAAPVVSLFTAESAERLAALQSEFDRRVLIVASFRHGVTKEPLPVEKLFNNVIEELSGYRRSLMIGWDADGLPLGQFSNSSLLLMRRPRTLSNVGELNGPPCAVSPEPIHLMISKEMRFREELCIQERNSRQCIHNIFSEAVCNARAQQEMLTAVVRHEAALGERVIHEEEREKRGKITGEFLMELLCSREKHIQRLTNDMAKEPESRRRICLEEQHERIQFTKYCEIMWRLANGTYFWKAEVVRPQCEPSSMSASEAVQPIKVDELRLIGRACVAESHTLAAVAACGCASLEHASRRAIVQDEAIERSRIEFWRPVAIDAANPHECHRAAQYQAWVMALEDEERRDAAIRSTLQYPSDFALDTAAPPAVVAAPAKRPKRPCSSPSTSRFRVRQGTSCHSNADHRSNKVT
jgi:hypothetical protein